MLLGPGKTDKRRWRCEGLKQIGLVNAEKLPGISGVLYGSRWGGKEGLGGAVEK